MRKITSILALLALLTIYIPTFAQPAPLPAADHWVMIHFDASDGCPAWTRVIKKNGGSADRCQASGKSQADAVCVKNGEIIEWRPQGSQSFSITNKAVPNPPLSNCAATTSGPANRYRCKVTATSGSHHYNVETSTCLLDPRILFN